MTSRFWLRAFLITCALLCPIRARAQSVSLSSLGRVDIRGSIVTLKVEKKTYTFELDSPFFKTDGKIYQLIAPVSKSGNDILVTKQFVSEFIPSTSTSPSPSPINKSPKESVSKVVIIDAGHGGRDSGKVGPNGLPEKTVTLSVANKLAALLKSDGYEVHMTRAADTLVSLADRPRFANQWKNGRPAALFVSIHANAGASAAQGFETYFLSDPRTADERRVAEMENAAVAFEEKKQNGPALEQVLNGLRNDYYQRASNDFAEVIQRQLGSFHPGPSRGVKQAGFRVLVGALMPAVLVEIAFISNPNEAQLLGTSAFQDKIAFSLARSIGAFFDSHEHLWQAEAAQ